jgi:hypothetical protein
MKSTSLSIMLVAFCIGAAATAQAAEKPSARGIVQARDIVVPAGTLMTCTLDEPKFSSATVSVGDPFLCHPRAIQQFGQIVFPRGTYFVGHLEADKDPGHFWGKGYLKLAFDRVGLPDNDLPITAKVIAVAGYNVDKQGKIIGHGHATRDTVEWLLPPLWPWKVLSLPARGPRPTLKGEVSITLRVMDDMILPQPGRESTTPGWHRFGEQPSSFPSSFHGSQAAPQPRAVASLMYQTAVTAAPAPDVTIPAATEAGIQAVSAIPADLVPVSQPAPAKLDVVAKMPAAGTAGSSLLNAWPANVTLFALADGAVFPATQYWRDQDQFWYVSDGDKVTISMRDIDWSTTARLNSARKVRVTLRNAPAQN